MKKIPLRTCVITKEKCEKKALFRIVTMPDGNVEYDESGKLSGKGAYLKKDLSVINKARKNKALNRILEVDVPDEIYDFLEKRLEDEKTN